MAGSDANEELTDRAAELTDYFELWWDLSNRESEPVYRPVIQAYESVFATVAHALLQGFAIITYQLFERRPDSHSIHSMLRQLERTRGFNVDPVRAEIEGHRHALGKVFALRNEVYAHRSSERSPEAIFEKVRLTPTEMRSVLTLVQSVVGTLVEANGGDSKEAIRERLHAKASIVREQSQALLVRLHPDGR